MFLQASQRYEQDQEAFACRTVLDDPYFKTRVDALTLPPVATLPPEAPALVEELLSLAQIRLPMRSVTLWDASCGFSTFETRQHTITCSTSPEWTLLNRRRVELRSAQK
jgi:hypothetical protein